MAKRDVTLPALKNGAGDKADRVIAFDSLAEFADFAQAAPISASIKTATRDRAWDAGQSYNDATALCRSGDMARVAPSDKFMSAFEDLAGYERQAFRVVNDVAGGVPNIGAYLAGNPVNMRRRARVMTEQAPLNIVVDLVSSGDIDAKALEKRGAAVLALVRLLSAIRPVNLYAVAAAKPYGQNTHTSVGVAVRLDTAPLDLARAAHVLCAPAVPRNIMYRLMGHVIGAGDDASLGWPYDNVAFYRKRGVEYWQRALGAEDCLFLAPPYLEDESISNPEKFIKEKLEEYGQAAE